MRSNRSAGRQNNSSGPTSNWLLAAALSLTTLVGCGQADPPVPHSAGTDKSPLAANTSDPSSAKQTIGPAVFKNEPINKFRQVFRYENISLGGQPTQNDIPAIQESGIKRVISVCALSEINWDEKAAVEAQGMEYYQFPMSSPTDIDGKSMEEIRKLLGESDENPVLLHCAGAVRVNAVWIAYRVLDQGVEWNQAVAESKSVRRIPGGWLGGAKSYVSAQGKGE